MSHASSAFIDLATFDDIESFLYAGPTAVTYFIRQHKKSSWFTQVPVVLTQSNGTPDFGASWSVSISRAGDYLLHTWLEVVTPAITANPAVIAPVAVVGAQTVVAAAGTVGQVGSFQIQFIVAANRITKGMIITTVAQLFGGAAVASATVLDVTLVDNTHQIITIDRALDTIANLQTATFAVNSGAKSVGAAAGTVGTVGSFQIQFTVNNFLVTKGMIITTVAQLFGGAAVASANVLDVIQTSGTTQIITIDKSLDTIAALQTATFASPLLPPVNFKNYWAKNFMHNLIDECTITFNDLIAHKITGEGLDFWAEFNVPIGKRVAYDRMIGAGVETLQENGKGSYFLHGVDASVARTFSLPLPFFFTRESGVALPTAAIPYNDMRINFKFKTLAQLLTSWNPSTHAITTLAAGVASLNASLTSAKVYANYAIVSNDERQLMGSTPRDIVIEQNQLAPITTLKDTTTATSYDIRFSHAVKSLTFVLRDVVAGTSTYASGAGYTGGVGGDGSFSCYHDRTINQPNELTGTYARSSPIASAKLLYENTTRLDMPTQYFTAVNPYYSSTTVPEEPGLHFYSYSLDSSSIDPMGSTNYGKLTNVSLSITPQGTQPVTSQVIVSAVNHNVIRVSGGAVGFPVM